MSSISINIRVLVTNDWMMTWPGSTQYILSREVSDHWSLVVKNRVVDCGSKPFRMFDVWHKEHDFKEMVKNVWMD